MFSKKEAYHKSKEYADTYDERIYKDIPCYDELLETSENRVFKFIY